MSSVKSVSTYSEKPWINGQVKRRYRVVLTDSNLVDHEIITSPFKVDPLDDGAAKADQELKNKIQGELSIEDRVPQWSDTQADYDRRALGRAMLEEDTEKFYLYLPLFKAMEARSGANANQRAITLGVTRADYDLMAARFGDVEGIAFFLDNAKGQIWDVLPPGWE